MKNKFLVIIVFVIGVTCTCSIPNEKTTTEIQKNDLLEYNLNGKVKDFSVLKYKVKDSFGVVLKVGIYTDEYSISSDYGEVISFNLEGYIDSKIKYNKGVLEWKKIITRDSLNKKTESNEFNSVNKVVSKQIFRYNVDGKISEMTSYDKTGSVQMKWIYKYEERKMTKNNYNSDGGMYSSYISSYNDKGELIEFEHLNYKEMKNGYTEKYTYNTEENTKTEIHKIGYLIYLPETKWFKKYNESGDIIEEIMDDYYVTKYEYKYDNYNNWITKIEYSDGFPKYIFEREIHYY